MTTVHSKKLTGFSKDSDFAAGADFFLAADALGLDAALGAFFCTKKHSSVSIVMP